MLCGSDASHSYAYEHIMKGSHQSYTQPDASWLEITSKEIKKLIALLLHFGFIKVGGSVDRNCSTETLRHGHVTGKIKTTEGWWTAVQVPQLRATGNYNKYMNAVDQSDQILSKDFQTCILTIHWLLNYVKKTKIMLNNNNNDNNNSNNNNIGSY